MTAIGETLRRERVGRNLELQQISRELRISSRFLDAIEREAFDELPGAIFVKSFVRQYAKFLGLDEDELAAAAQRIVEPAEEEAAAKNHPMAPVDTVRVPPMRAWEAVGDGGRFGWSSALPALAWVVAAMLVCSGIYAWWQRERGSAAVFGRENSGCCEAGAAPAAMPAPTAPAPLDTSQTPVAQGASSTEARPVAVTADGGQSAPAPVNAQPAAATPPETQPPPEVSLPQSRRRQPPGGRCTSR